MGRIKGSKNKKRKYTHKVEKVVTTDDIIDGVRELRKAFDESLMAIRKELVEALADVRNFRKGEDATTRESDPT